MTPISIALSGPCGVGKTTLVRELVELLRKTGYKTKAVKCPDYETETGKIIARYQRGHEDLNPSDATALYRANVLEVWDKVDRMVDDVEVVVWDRGCRDQDVYERVRGAQMTHAMHRRQDLTIVLNAPYEVLIGTLLTRGERRPAVFRELSDSVRYFHSHLSFHDRRVHQRFDGSASEEVWLIVLEFLKKTLIDADASTSDEEGDGDQAGGDKQGDGDATGDGAGDGAQLAC